MHSRTLGMALLAVSMLALPWRAGADEEEEKREKFHKHYTEGARLYDKKEYEKSIEEFKEALKYDEKHNGTYYNIACNYALLKKTDEAVKWLGDAIDKGFHTFTHIDGDSDLDSIRGTEAFKTMYAAAKRKVIGEPVISVVEPPGLDRTKPTPLIIALHGHGESAAGHAAKWKEAAESAGVILACVQGTTKLTAERWGYNEEFALTQALDCLEEMKGKFSVDPKKTFVSGSSQGGLMAYDIAFRRGGVFAGLIVSSAHYPKGNFRLAELAPKARHLGVYLLQAKSEFSTKDEAKRAKKNMESNKVSMVFEEYEGVEFLPGPDQLKKAIEWCMNLPGPDAPRK
ncbi:MAG: hypothetical protein HYY93_06430 [Planctomycetes bacterium]|nr:hypothetical protein [Planctomycetota bacterium]